MFVQPVVVYQADRAALSRAYERAPSVPGGGRSTRSSTGCASVP